MVMPLENSIASASAKPVIGLEIVPVGEPRISVSGAPGAEGDFAWLALRAPSICNVAPGSMVMDPVPLTAPWISSAPPVEEAGAMLFDASIVPLLTTKAAITPTPTKVPVVDRGIAGLPECL